MDLAIIETNNGGDIVKNPKDLLILYGFQNMPYLAMFGGNVAQSTPSKRLDTQQAFDWWGNTLLMPNDPSLQFNSETERALNTIPLTSAGRIDIENAIKSDLQFMQSFVNITIETAITGPDRLEIALTLKRPDNLQSTQFVYIWDATNRELSIIKDASGNPIPFDAGIFDFAFGPEFE